MRLWHWLAIAGAVAIVTLGNTARRAIRARLLYSSTAKARGLSNLPTSDATALVDWLADRAAEVLALAKEHDASAELSSGYRAPEVNAAVDGSPTSRHTRMLAFDVRLANAKPGAYHALARYIRDQARRLSVAPRMVIAEVASPHLHVDYFHPTQERSTATAWKQEQPGRERGARRVLQDLA